MLKTSLLIENNHKSSTSWCLYILKSFGNFKIQLIKVGKLSNDIVLYSWWASFQKVFENLTSVEIKLLLKFII